MKELTGSDIFKFYEKSGISGESPCCYEIGSRFYTLWIAGKD